MFLEQLAAVAPREHRIDELYRIPLAPHTQPGLRPIPPRSERGRALGQPDAPAPEAAVQALERLVQVCLALVDQADLVAQARDLRHLVRREEDRPRAARHQLEQAVDHVFARHRIEPAERLVEQQQFRAVGEVRDQPRLHHLPARQLPQPQPARQVESRDHALAEFLVPGRVERCEVPDQLLQSPVARVLLRLGDKAEPLQLRRSDFPQRCPENLSLASRGAQGSGERHQRGRFAGTVRTEQPERRPALHLEVEVAHRFHFSVAHAEP